MRIKKIFSCFLMFVLSFNFILVCTDEASAMAQEAVKGPRDRVRKFYDGGDKCELDFTYSKAGTDDPALGGFFCKPGKLKFFEPSEKLSEAPINDTVANLIAGVYSVFVEIFLGPVICIATISTLMDLAEGDKFATSFEIILLALGLGTLDKLNELVLGEDDYNLDAENPACLIATISILVSCLAMFIIFKSSIEIQYKLLAILGISASIYILKQIFKAVQYSRAVSLFDSLQLCGDNWLTYGDVELETKILESTSSDKRISLAQIKENFPTRSSFFGSYSYELDQCFTYREIDFCRKAFNKSDMTDEQLDRYASYLYRPYREFMYGGIEFANTDDNCKDPRPERPSYIGTNSSDSKSQLYYFRGTDAANFACERFAVKSAKEYRDAYKCCLEASQKLICVQNIENGQRTHVMCSKDSSPDDCKIGTNQDIEDISSNGTTADYTVICENLKNTTINSGEICDSKPESECSEAPGGKDCCDAYKNYNEICKDNEVFADFLKSVPGYTYVNDIVGKKDDTSSTFDKAATTVGNAIYEPFSQFSKTTKLKIRKSKLDSAKYCVESYDFCPYNFRIMGGSETFGKEFSPSYKSGFIVKDDSNNGYEEDTKEQYVKDWNKRMNCTFDEDGNRHCMSPCYENNGNGEANVYDCFNKPSNFCQIDRHCVRINVINTPEVTNTSPYIDKACLDHVGSSHNFINYENMTGGLKPKKTRLITTPLVECTVETFKNMLFNRAGHTKCLAKDDYPDDLGECYSGTQYKSGENLDNKPEYRNAFRVLKKYMIRIVMALLALALVIYGYNILVLNKGATPEEIMKLILKMTCVSYFAFSNNWINPVFDTVYGLYGTVTEFAIRILLTDPETISYENHKYSGCYFFKNDLIANNYESYGSRKYLSVFDTLDCKLSRYFGYYTENIENPPIISMFILGIFTFGLAIIMVLPFILIFVSLLFFAIRVSYLFIVESLTITILLLLTPIFVPLALFERTKESFKKWFYKIIQSILSPMFLFMSLGLFFVIFDKYYVGEARFHGTKEPIRSIFCGEICKFEGNNVNYITGSFNSKKNKKETCRKNGGKIVNIMYSSPICVTQATNSTSKSGIGILDFLLEDFMGIPKLATQAVMLFPLFPELLFILVLIFIFEQLVSYINSMTATIFSYEGRDGKGIDPGASGLPSLQDVVGVVVSAAAKMANESKNISKGAVNKGINEAKSGGGGGKGGGDALQKREDGPKDSADLKNAGGGEKTSLKNEDDSSGAYPNENDDSKEKDEDEDFNAKDFFPAENSDSSESEEDSGGDSGESYPNS
ncbi:MAG: type IV secretion system protein [Rickettsiales bacterium]|jgi:hypothetical protein|nr:type IV secretion system protein [Rickettsiales bacterium]